MSKKHSKLSPSATKRWINCPGSLKLSEGMRNEESVYAAEGTAAHDIAERALSQGAKACMVSEDSEASKAVQVYLDEIEFIRSTNHVICEHTERTLQCTTIPGLGGTADHVMVYRDNADKIVLHCLDYKHGVGVPVDAEENDQVLSYFVILESHYPDMIDEYRGTIVQPRCFAGEAVQTWSCTPERVREHAKRIIEETQKTHLSAGDWCRWCPALMICPEVQEQAAAAACEEFSQVDLDTLLHYEKVAPAIQAFLKQIPKALLDLFRFGDGIPGKKVIKRYGNRKWKLATSLVQPELEKLGLPREVIVEEKLRTPPQVEKLLDKDGKKVIESLVTREEIGYKIVPVTAKGDAVNFGESEFTDYLEFEDNGED